MVTLCQWFLQPSTLEAPDMTPVLRVLTFCVGLAALLSCAPAPVTLPGATPPPAAGAEILWDTWGVPHIFAKDDRSLFYALGWAQMQSHGDLLLKTYGEARGRAAEYWGKDY